MHHAWVLSSFHPFSVTWTSSRTSLLIVNNPTTYLDNFWPPSSAKHLRGKFRLFSDICLLNLCFTGVMWCLLHEFYLNQIQWYFVFFHCQGAKMSWSNQTIFRHSNERVDIILLEAWIKLGQIRKAICFDASKKINFLFQNSKTTIK